MFDVVWFPGLECRFWLYAWVSSKRWWTGGFQRIL